MKSVFWPDDYSYQIRKNIFKIPGLLIRDFKYCWQRITRGYCDRDIWSIDDWFLGVVPDMLQQLKDTRHGSPGILGENYANEEGIICNDTCHSEWNKILGEMIFLLREASEDTCMRKNPMEEEHCRIFSEYTKQYGLFGEKLQMEEEKEKEGKTWKGGKSANSFVMHFASELPQYEEAENRYIEENRKLEEYRDECKNQGLGLFTKWFWHLWD